MIHINFPKVLRIPNFSTIKKFDASCIEAENDELKRVQTINHLEKKSSQVSNECIEATIKLFRPNKSFGICICTNLCY